jgi:hypothetical protein
MTGTLMEMQVLIPTTIQVADGSVTMQWSENLVSYSSTLMLYVVGFWQYVLAPPLLLHPTRRKVDLTECSFSTLTTPNALLRDFRLH